jgi:signal peptidase I
MEKTIVPGDMVWVNNLTYGPRLPYSPYEISWINVLVWLWEGKEADVKKTWWDYKRLKGYSSPQRGDISVFNHPYNNTIFIKRIVALPGDTLQIMDGQLMVNGREQTKPENSVYYSKARFNNRQEAYSILDSLQINMFQKESPIEGVQ